MLATTAIALSAGASIAGGVAKQAGSLIDVATAPNQLRSIGKISEATLMNGTIPFVEVYATDDLSLIAETYERTGYRVNKVITDRYYDNFQDWLNRGLALWNIRHFFNPIQFSSIDIDPEINVPNDLTRDFETRLNNGIRFWNVGYSDVNMGNFKYDNVEEAYLNG